MNQKNTGPSSLVLLHKSILFFGNASFHYSELDMKKNLRLECIIGSLTCMRDFEKFLER